MNAIDTLRGLITASLIVAFLAICWYAFRRRHRQRFDDVARGILDDADEAPTERVERAATRARAAAHEAGGAHAGPGAR